MRRELRAAAVGAALLLVAGCGGNGDGDGGREVRIGVDKPRAAADEPVRIRVTGLAAGQEVTVTSQATDYAGTAWTGRAVFTADGAGAVDLTRARPSAGTYSTADGMGLFWSMNPGQGRADESWFVSRWPEDQAGYEVRLAVHAAGERLASRVLTRTWLAEGTTHRLLTAAREGVHGALYLPPAGAPRRSPVLSFGGSEGGMGDKYAAALLASRGHPVLVLCYFNCADRPGTLKGIALEYFATAARLLARESGRGPGQVDVIGYSRGSEAAQLLAQHYPDLVDDVVVYAPSHRANPGFPDGKAPAWTKGGRPVPYGPLPLGRVRGTVLAIAGGADGLWPAAASARSIGGQRGASGERHRALIYPHAGHGVGTHPYTPAGLRFRNPLVERELMMGGTRQADAQARTDSWRQVRALLGNQALS
ncbi:acyl-CoA thioesterase/bile acid-CoA:amino acid N-acyltransferase family protein [Streptomyces tsukubensis]|uniref:acyl-CoA thioesterase/bile acid-CoA:amino acid N-acyltransferase family protein n=1 Tax=Streptomyces tsukubensis TaxID=83656 RepID=UPI0034510358